jgi:transcription elongation factor GreA
MSNFLTQEGLQQLRDRSAEISNNLIPAIQVDINNARDQGDLKENAGFQTALKVRDELVAELSQIEEVLNSGYQIVDSSASTSDSVRLGNTVILEFVATKNKQTVKIVGTSESNVLEGKISNLSPLAESILTKAKGDICEFKAPNGLVKVKILEIQ